MTKDEAKEKIINDFCKCRVWCELYPDMCQMESCEIWWALKALLDRPKGEWIRTGRTNIYGGIEVQCSNCNDKVMVQHLEDERYCRHCGADMGMKGADDEND